MQPEISPYIYVAFTVVTAIGVLMQAFILLGIFLGLRKLQRPIENILTQVDQHVLPMVAASKATLEQLGPKLKTITENLAEISETVKQESHHVKASVDDVLEKTRAQTERVDEIVSGTLDGLVAAGAHIQSGVAVPLRYVNGIFNGIRAGLGVLRSKTPPVPPVYEVDEPEVVVVVEEVVSGRPLN
jgi:phage-related protein